MFEQSFLAIVECNSFSNPRSCVTELCCKISGIEIHSVGIHLSIFQIKSQQSLLKATGNVNSALKMFLYKSYMFEALNGTAPQTIA